MEGRGANGNGANRVEQRERDRLKVLHEVQQKQLTQLAAAERLKVSDRHVRRMLLRLRERGDRSVVHGLRGRPSNRKLATRFEQKILARLRQRYADFGPTLAAEHLTQEGFAVSRETLRKWMTQAALWRPRSQRVKAVHVWRERRASFGELVMQDSSPFRWLEERGPVCHLIALIDDATSRIWGRFTEHDTTEENLRTLGGWLRRYGRPLAQYTDKNSIFRTAGPQPLVEQLRGDPLGTQFGRALHELGIEWIAAHSPQAKGRIERLFETLQDRLVKEMRLAGIDSMEAANHFLETRFLPEWEQRFNGGSTKSTQCPSTTGARTSPGRNSERACGSPSRSGPHGQLGRKSLGGSAGRSLRRAPWSSRRDRTAAGWKPLVALPRALSAPALLPRTGANDRKSFRPTASRTCGTNSKTQKQNHTQIPCACRAPLEKTMEADISTLRKTGHFYFALTSGQAAPDNSPPTTKSPSSRSTNDRRIARPSPQSCQFARSTPCSGAPPRSGRKEKPGRSAA
jgi:hypothetical protein